MSSSLKSPPEGLKNAECKKGTPPIRPPIPYVPLTDLHEKRETKQIKVKLPNGTKFQMPTYGSWNNKEYLVHIIAVLQLVKQKGTAAKVKEAFVALVKVRKEMSPFFNFPEDESPAKKEARKKKLSNLNDSFKAKKSFAVKQAQRGLRAVPLLHCWRGANTMGQDRKRDAHEESLDRRQWQIQQSDSREILDFIHGLHRAPQANHLPC
jgi:hypothetical protein